MPNQVPQAKVIEECGEVFQIGAQPYKLREIGVWENCA